MKVYLFYQIANKRGPFEEPLLYAFTDNKELAKEFKTTRNMSLFYYKEKEISKKDYTIFQDNTHHYMLGYYEFITKPTKPLLPKEKIHMVATEEEGIQIYSREDLIFSILGKYTSPYLRPEMFKRKYRKLLSTIGYFIIQEWENSLPFFDMAGGDIDELSVFISNKWIIDTFQLFLYYYGDLMK